MKELSGCTWTKGSREMGGLERGRGRRVGGGVGVAHKKGRRLVGGWVVGK